MFKTVKLLLQKGSLRVVVSYFNDWSRGDNGILPHPLKEIPRFSIY
eukprot:COSAG01_NODE_10265_length_2206_cov_1.252966_1_plen_46_part_00